MKSVAIIGTVGVPAKYGGFETLTEFLIEELSSKYTITVYCSAKSYETPLKDYKGAKLTYIPFKANGVQSIPYDMLSLLKAARSHDVLLVLGVSGALILPLIRLISKSRLVINIDGLEWRREKWGGAAKKFLKFSEALAVRYADRVIADNAEIARYVREEYHKESELIAYGADHVRALPLTDALYEAYPFLKNPYAFKVCRIEPENNIHVILEAFSRSSAIPLVMIGNWQGSEYGRALKETYDKHEWIHLLNPIYDQTILDPIRGNCAIYLHGHSAGGTNPSLVEAMYLGLDIFAFDVAYNKETTEGLAHYFSDADDLMKQLEVHRESESVGKMMQEIAKRRYRWSVIADAYAKTF